MSISTSSSVAVLCVAVALVGESHAQPTWEEGWDSSTVGSYIPLCDAVPSFVPGQKGNWYLGDTVSCFDPDCGSTQNRAHIDSDGGDKKLRLTSVSHTGGCANNVWLTLDYRIVPVSIPIAPGVQVAFTETGSLVNPQWGGAFPTVAPPPGDNVHLRFMDNNGNMLVYLLQRAANYMPHTVSLPAELPGGGIGNVGYHEVLLDTYDAAGGTYVRDLHADFSQAPGFTASGSTIIAIVFEVTNVGEGTLDDLQFGTNLVVPDGPLRILADTAERLPNGQFRFQFEGAQTSEVEVQGSTNASNWSLLQSFTNQPSPTEFTDPASNLPWRLYRLMRRGTN